VSLISEYETAAGSAAAELRSNRFNCLSQLPERIHSLGSILAFLRDKKMRQPRLPRCQ
jgi:hypothetical protein